MLAPGLNRPNCPEVEFTEVARESFRSPCEPPVGTGSTRRAQSCDDSRTMHARAIHVIRWSPEVAERLQAAPPDAGRVHSVFERVLNLDLYDGRLLTLHGAGPLLAPFAAALSQAPCWGRLRPGVRACRRGDAVLLEDVRLEWPCTTTIDTAMPHCDGDPGRALTLLATHVVEGSGSGLSSTIARRAQARIGEGVTSRDPRAFLEGALGLVGLGEGLTPAGDDCL